jgi:hypothetical protein
MGAHSVAGFGADCEGSSYSSLSWRPHRPYDPDDWALVQVIIDVGYPGLITGCLAKGLGSGSGRRFGEAKEVGILGGTTSLNLAKSELKAALADLKLFIGAALGDDESFSLAASMPWTGVWSSHRQPVNVGSSLAAHTPWQYALGEKLEGDTFMKTCTSTFIVSAGPKSGAIHIHGHCGPFFDLNENLLKDATMDIKAQFHVQLKLCITDNVPTSCAGTGSRATITCPCTYDENEHDCDHHHHHDDCGDDPDDSDDGDEAAFNGRPCEKSSFSSRIWEAGWLLLVAVSFALPVILVVRRLLQFVIPRGKRIPHVLLDDDGRSWHLWRPLPALSTWKGGRSRYNRSEGRAALNLAVVFTILFSLVASPQALTISNQTVTTQVTWTTAESPVSVTGLVTIASGGSLTVVAGVQVIFETASSGIVNTGGTLLILGEPTNRVQLQPRGNGTWQGISFGPSAVSALFATDPVDIVQYQGGSVVEFADLRRAGTSSLSALDFDFGATPYLRHVNLIECRGRSATPIWLNRTTGTFVGDFIRLSRETPSSTYAPSKWLEAVGVSSGSGFVLLRNLETMLDREAVLMARDIRAVSVLESIAVGRATFQNIDVLTLERNSFFSTVATSYVLVTSNIKVAYIRDNALTGSSSASQADVLYASETGMSSAVSALLSLDVSGNVLLNGGVRFFCSSCRRNMTISNNTVDGSRTGGIRIDSSGSLALLNNTIKNCNSAAPSTSTFYVASRSGGYGGSIVCLENRVVRSASAGAVLTLDCDTESCSFEHNLVQDCAAAALVSFDGLPWKFQLNLFVNSTAQVSVSISPASPLTMKDTIALPANHWGLLQADVSGPRLTVSDAFVTSKGPIVSFETVLTGPSSSSSLQAVSVPGGLLPDGSVGGLLDGNSTMELAPGNYTCRLSFILRDSAKLVLSGDTGIAFASSRSLVLLGDTKLIAVGGAPRLFNASVSYWQGIIVDTNATTALSNVHVQMATVAIDHKGDGGLFLHGIKIEKSDRSCIVSSPSGGGVMGSFLISGGSVRNCGSDAISIRLRASASVLNTSISQAVGTSARGLFVSGPSSILSSSEIADNTFTSCGVYVSCSYKCELLVERNTIAGSMPARSSARPLYIYSVGSKDVVVQDNIIEEWNVSENLAAFDVTFSAGSDPSVGLDVSRNTFRNISAGNVLAITYSSSKRASNIGNIFQRSLAATSTTFPALIVVHAWPSDSGGVRPAMRGNIFHEELQGGANQRYIQVRSTVSQVKSIDASRSYWANVSEATLVDRISDGNDVFGLSVLQYLPVLLTTNPDGPVGPNTSSLGFVQPGGIMTGTLGASENATLERGNYSAVDTVTVDGRLTILPGAQVAMDPGVSLVVRNGSLVIAGSPNEPVLFVTAVVGSSWGQIRVLPNVTGHQTLLLSNVIISGAGSGSLPAIHTQRESGLTNVSIKDCVGGGVLVDGNFRMLSMNNVRSVDVNSGSTLFNVKIAGTGVAIINNAFLSSNAIYELAAYDAAQLSAENLEIYPKASFHYGVYAANTNSAIKSLTYNTSLLSNRGTGYALYAQSSSSLELLSSRVVFGRYGARVSSASSSNYSFVGNTWIGHASSFNFFESNQVGSVSLSFYNNTFERSGCSSDCFRIDGQRVEFAENLVIGVTASNSSSLIRLTSIESNIVGNRFENISGYSGLAVVSAPASFNFSRNAWVNAGSLAFLVTTSTLYENVQGGIYRIPGNFWDTTSFETLQARTLDAQDDPRLAYVLYSEIFVDPGLTTRLDAPATSPCLDRISKTIACVIRYDTTVVVPSGLYYAPRSITLRHANAILVFEAGVRIMFAAGASIRIDEGTFEVRGTETNPVIMTSTSRLLGEFGVADVQNSTRWGGVWLGPNAKPSVIQFGEYVSGSVLQGCVIQNAGFFNSPAALYLGQVSVLLDRVSVIDSGSDGVQLVNSRGTILLKELIISGSARYGLYLNAPTSEVTLQKVTVQGSRNRGVYASSHQNLRILDCRFSDNDGYQVFSTAGQGILEVAKRCVAARKRTLALLLVTNLVRAFSVFTGSQSYGLWVYLSTGLRVLVSESTISGTKRPVFVQAREATLSFR